MRTRTCWCVGACLVAGLFWTASSGGQPKEAVPPAPPPREDAFPTTLDLRPVVAQQPPAVAPQPSPSIDQLIKSLTDIRAAKAELDKQEQAVLQSLKAKLKEQREVLKKMGVELDEPAKAELPGNNLPLLDDHPANTKAQPPRIDLPSLDKPEKK